MATTTTADFERADRIGTLLDSAGIHCPTYAMDGSTIIFRCVDMAQARAGQAELSRRSDDGYPIRAKAQKRHGEPSLIVRR